jgi:hypothetical protein
MAPIRAPLVENCVPDYSVAAMSEKALRLVAFQHQLAAIDTSEWSVAQLGDYDWYAKNVHLVSYGICPGTVTGACEVGGGDSPSEEMPL